MSEVKINILVEALLGIDPTTTNLVNGTLDEYWLKDETETPSITGYDGTITGNYWEIEGGDTLQINATGSTSECWELEGGDTLQIKA